MKIYTIKKIFTYSETVKVEAENESEAKDKSGHVDGDRNEDDTWYDTEVVNVREIGEKKEAR
jgi:hypothetical protein